MPLFGRPTVAAMKAAHDVKGLIKALDDRDAYVRFTAAEALIELRKSGQWTQVDQQSLQANREKLIRAANPESK
jgi:HEAT repeat protein